MSVLLIDHIDVIISLKMSLTLMCLPSSCKARDLHCDGLWPIHKQPFDGTFLKDIVIEQSILNQLSFLFKNALQNLLEILEDSENNADTCNWWWVQNQGKKLITHSIMWNDYSLVTNMAL